MAASSRAEAREQGSPDCTFRLIPWSSLGCRDISGQRTARPVTDREQMERAREGSSPGEYVLDGSIDLNQRQTKKEAAHYGAECQRVIAPALPVAGDTARLETNHQVRRRNPSEIGCNQIIRPPASANIELCRSSTDQITVRIEHAEAARLIGAGIWFNSLQRGFVNVERGLDGAVMPPKSYGTPRLVIRTAVIWKINHVTAPGRAVAGQRRPVPGSESTFPDCPAGAARHARPQRQSDRRF